MGSEESLVSMTPGSARSSKALDVFTPKSKNFRSRKLDYGKPLAIIRESDIDLDDNAALMMRSVPVVATGVDKEEEEEHHLKVILESAPTASSANIHIPIPDSEDTIVSYYHELYSSGFELSKSYYKAPPPPRIASHLNSLMPGSLIGAGLNGSNLVGLGFGAKVSLSVPVETPLLANWPPDIKLPLSKIPYHATSKDQLWVASINHIKLAASKRPLTEDLFEKAFWILETLANTHGWESIQMDFLSSTEAIPFVDKWISEPEFGILSTIHAELFDYWRSKRIKSAGIPLCATLKIEDNPNSTIIDPYVCFRRRELRMLRKTRRSDALSLEKIRRLRSIFAEFFDMASQAVDRDKMKKEALTLDTSIFNMTLQLEEWKRRFNVPIRPGLVPSTSMSLANQSTERDRIFPGRKRIRAIVNQSDDSAMEHDAHLLRQDSLHFRKPSFRAGLFGSKKTYRDIRRIYSRTGILDHVAHDGTPAFSSTAPWSQFFHPIEVARVIDKELEKKLASDRQKPFISDFVANYCQIQRQRLKEMPLSEQFFSDTKDNSWRTRYRIGRGGRMIVDRTRWSDEEPRFVRPSGGKIKPIPPYETARRGFEAETELANIRLLSWQDLSQLNSANVINYNQHYMVMSGGRSVATAGALLGDWATVTRLMNHHSSSGSSSANMPGSGTSHAESVYQHDGVHAIPGSTESNPASFCFGGAGKDSSKMAEKPRKRKTPATASGDTPTVTPTKRYKKAPRISTGDPLDEDMPKKKRKMSKKALAAESVVAAPLNSDSTCVSEGRTDTLNSLPHAAMSIPAGEGPLSHLPTASLPFTNIYSQHPLGPGSATLPSTPMRQSLPAAPSGSAQSLALPSVSPGGSGLIRRSPPQITVKVRTKSSMRTPGNGSLPFCSEPASINGLEGPAATGLDDSLPNEQPTADMSKSTFTFQPLNQRSEPATIPPFDARMKKKHTKDLPL